MLFKIKKKKERSRVFIVCFNMMMEVNLPGKNDNQNLYIYSLYLHHLILTRVQYKILIKCFCKIGLMS